MVLAPKTKLEVRVMARKIEKNDRDVAAGTICSAMSVEVLFWSEAKDDLRWIVVKI